MRIIGLMSGTSMDGVDAALIETDGRRISVRVSGNGFVSVDGATGSLPYDGPEGSLLRRAKEEARGGLSDRAARPGSLAEAEALVTRRHADAVEALLAAAGLEAADIDAVGFHGQTVLHRPELGLTVQIGDGQALADRLGIAVVHDFRAADVAAGGEGAPLVPVFHRALAESCGYPLPLAVLNIGGVANLSLIGRREDDLVGFDTGPGNALLDDLMEEREGVRLDEGGRVAASGQPDAALLAWMLRHPYFERPPPKSLDRDAFSHRMVAVLATGDAAATLTAFTAAAVARGLAEAPEAPLRLIVGGGGASNGELMRRLRATIDRGTEIVGADEIGWSSSFLEAQAFAFLAARRLRHLPISFPATTGVREPTVGGVVSRPR